MPHADGVYLEELTAFCIELLNMFFTKLPPDTSFDFEEWLQSTDYTETRKNELREVYSKMPIFGIPTIYKVVKCFIKWEFYTEYKPVRGIYARVDEFKCLFGPIVKAIEKIVYNTLGPDGHPWFIKTTPVADRPRIISEHFASFSKVMVSDYSSFEQSFRPRIMKAIDFPILNWFLGSAPVRNKKEIFETLSGVNKLVFKWFTIYNKAQRCSGEMNTSLSNGIANLFVNLFIMKKEYGIDPRDIVARVEGDDGLFANKYNIFPTKKDFEKAGFVIKIDIHDSPETSGFCGLIFAVPDYNVMADPWKHLGKFGWCKPIYNGARKSTLLMLLRAKGYSYLYGYNGCPILGALADYALRVTNGIDIRRLLESKNIDNYERSNLKVAYQSIQENRPRLKEPGIASRFLFEKLYNISVEEQIAFEQYVKSLNVVQPLTFNFANPPQQLVQNSLNYVHIRPLGKLKIPSLLMTRDILQYNYVFKLFRSPIAKPVL